MESIIILIMFIGSLSFIYFIQIKRDKAEQLRFREFVIANKSKDVIEYSTALPDLEDTELPIQEELQDVNDVDPEKLLYAIRQEQEDK